ncbi:MAG TPA: hypothetical protein VHL34_05335 [Rhizomicrobium sp.]|jgi:hypothetical protein|nr:hypothetical protein [Rhizomicrobium sp.]
MIATDRFVFLHLHKAGGTFANACIMRFVPGAQPIGYHLPRALLPQQHLSKPLLGLVRNPWSYYVSWYAFQSGRKQQNALFRILSDDGRKDFEGTIRGMLELGSGSPLLGPIAASLPQRYGGNGINLPGFALTPIAKSGLGFFSYLNRYMYAGVPAVRVAKMERLRSDFTGLLESTGFVVSDAMRAFIQNEAPQNISQHAPYQTYYSAGLRDLVAERDAEVIRMHGYTFED